MPTQVQQALIPFGNLQSSGMEELGGGMPIAMNVVSDLGGTVRKRPGLVPYFTAGSSKVLDANGVSLLYETSDGDVYAVAGTVPSRSIYFVTTAGGSNVSMRPGGDLAGTARPTVTETEALLVFAGGFSPEKLELATKLPSRLGGTPPNASHVIGLADRLLMNTVLTDTDAKSQVFYSAPAVGSDFSGNEDWSTAILSGIFRASARPDAVVAVYGSTDEAFVFGTTTLQVFATNSDPANPFQPSVTRELGTVAPYSIVQLDQSFAWLDHHRRFVVSDGRSQEFISGPIQKTLHDMGTVSDCFGYRIVLGYIDAVVWTFPTDGRTFVYQQGAGWAEWSGWDGTHWTAFPVTAATVLKSQAKTLVGTNTGQVATLALDNPTDFGSSINAYMQTGFQNHDTDAYKSCNRVRFALRRGQTTTPGEPFILLSWRDDLGPWEEPIPLSLGAAADYDPVVQLTGLGTYRRRQWRLEFTDAADLAFVSATEEYEVLPG